MRTRNNDLPHQNRGTSPSMDHSQHHIASPSVKLAIGGKSVSKKQLLGNDLSQLKLLHQKRRQPELYLAKNVSMHESEPQNNFNKILKKSLLNPSKSRDVQTYRESNQIHSMTRNILENHKREEKLKSIEYRRAIQMNKSVDINTEDHSESKMKLYTEPDERYGYVKEMNVEILPLIGGTSSIKIDLDADTKDSDAIR